MTAEVIALLQSKVSVSAGVAGIASHVSFAAAVAVSLESKRARWQRLRRRTYQPSGWETGSAHNRKQWSQDGKSMPVARMTSEGLEPSSRNPMVNHSSILQLSHDKRAPVTCPHSPIPLTVPASWHWHSVKTKESVCEPGGFTRTVPCPRDITCLQYNSVVGLPCGPKQHPACTSGF